MAEFEGEKNLNRETSELEVKGKFKLSEEELDNVAGGCGTPKYNGYPTRGSSWAICDWYSKQNPGVSTCYYCPKFSSLPSSMQESYELDGYCTRG